MIDDHSRLPYHKEGTVALILALAAFETLVVICMDGQSVLETIIR